MWQDRRIIDMLGIEHPIIQAPMAGSNDAALAIAVANAGGLGSLPCATISPDQMRSQIELFRQQTAKPLNVNFFAHTTPASDASTDAAWKALLRPQYSRIGLDPDAQYPGAGRAPFDDAYCDALEPFRPAVVSFHFGLPHEQFVRRVKSWGAKVLSSATTVAEAVWLEQNGCDAIIAQGAEAGGHRGHFLATDLLAAIARQPGTLALVPQIVDAVSIPVIAAGGIGDARGIAAALMLGASAVQLGTSYLLCAEAKTSALHRVALAQASDEATTMTNLFTGRPARGIVNHVMSELGAVNRTAPAFPLASNAMAPLRAQAEANGSSDYSPLWAGQAARLARAMPAADLTRELAAATQSLLANAARRA